MSEKYIKRINKGKGHKKKKLIKKIDEISQNLNPIINISLGLMIIDKINKKKKEENK